MFILRKTINFHPQNAYNIFNFKKCGKILSYTLKKSIELSESGEDIYLKCHTGDKHQVYHVQSTFYYKLLLGGQNIMF